MTAADKSRKVWLLVGALGFSCGGEVANDTDQTIQGYLVFVCPWQAYPRLADVKSAGGLSCYLDTFFSTTAPESGILAACDEEPLSSRCLLEAAGLTTDDSVVQATLHGDWQMLDVCRSGAKCASKEKDCEWECQPERVFVPTAVDGQ